MARSLNDLVPADNQLPMDAALAWSRAEWEREEAERQQRLLEEAARRHSQRAEQARADDVVTVDDSGSDDEWYQPSPSPPRRHVGDPGQSSSRRAADPGPSSSRQPLSWDDSDDDDGGDYTTAMYRQFGMYAVFLKFLRSTRRAEFEYM